MKRMVDHRFSRKRFAATEQPMGSATPATQCVRSLRFAMHCRPQPIQRHLSLAHAMLRRGVEQPIVAPHHTGILSGQNGRIGGLPYHASDFIVLRLAHQYTRARYAEPASGASAMQVLITYQLVINTHPCSAHFLL